MNNGQQVILKDFGHTETFWNSQPEARAHMLSTFFDTGEVDASLYKYQPVNFNAGLGWPALAKVMLGTVVAVVLLIVALVWMVVRRARRRTISHATFTKRITI
jgi:hypothetical protein